MPHRKVHRKSDLGIELSPQWVTLAVVIALLVHVALYAFLRSTELRKFGEAYYEKIVPRSFKLKRVEIDPALLDQDMADKPLDQTEQPPETIVLPRDTPMATEPPEEVRITPEATQPLDLASTLASEKPAVSSSISEALAAASQQSAASKPSSELPELEVADLESGSPLTNRPTISLPPSQNGTGSSTQSGPDFTNLDALLAQTGPVADGQPILMDAGLLFDYDSATLRPAAATDLAKVAALIARSPGSTIIVEGHTDSFGSDDYNFELSRQRALSVKQWLVEQAGIPSDRIATTGFGKRRLIAPATGSIEEQQINRRVEIIIKKQ